MKKYNEYFIKPTKKQEELLKKSIEIGMEFFDGSLRKNKFLLYKDPTFFFKRLNESLPINPVKVEKSLDVLREIGKYSIAQFDRTYLSFPDSGNSLQGMIGAIFSKMINQNLIGFDRSAPIATVIEIQLIEWLRELIGYEHKSLKEIKSLSEVSGMVVTGGHMANHVAIMGALNNRFPEIKEKGLASLNVSPVILLSKKISHYSLDSAVHHLGIGKENIIDIHTKRDFRTDYTKLGQIIKNLPKNKVPFMIVGMAGNTRTANLDNINQLVTFCRKNNLWLHIDACHGGSLLFSEKLKKKFLKGIEKSDSVSIDPHKSLFVPYPSSFVLFKKRDILTMFTRYPEKAREGQIWDLGFITPFYGSRGFESLSFWMLIKIMGIKGIKNTIEYRNGLAKYAEKLIEESGLFVKLNEMDFYRMAFVYCPKDIHNWLKNNGKIISQEQKEKILNLINKYTHKINQTLYEAGAVCLDEYSLHDMGNRIKLYTKERFLVMAITMGNPLYTKTSIRNSLGILFKKAKKEEKYFKNDFKNLFSGKRD